MSIVCSLCYYYLFNTFPFLQLLDGPLYVADIPQQSERSTNGPDAFGLEARKIMKQNSFPMTIESSGVFLPTQPNMEVIAESCTQIVDDGTELENQDVVGGPLRAFPVDRGRFTPTHLASQRQQVEVSEFKPRDVISKCRLRYLVMLWGQIRDKLSRCPIEKLASIKDDVYEVFSEMENTNVLDLSLLKNLLDTAFGNAKQYEAALEDVSRRLPADMHDEKLSTLCEHLAEAEMAEKAHLQQVQSSRSKLTEIQGRREELQKELAALQKEEDEVALSLSKSNEGLQGLTTRVSQLRVEITDLESNFLLQPEEMDVLNKMKELLEGNRRDLADFELSP